MQKKRYLWPLVCLSGIVMLGGCVPDHWPQKWVDMANPPPKTAAKEPEPTWCYRTLAAIDCYASPQMQLKESLVSAPPVPSGKNLPQRAPKTNDANAPLSILPQQ
jgi:hypothetical protein